MRITEQQIVEHAGLRAMYRGENEVIAQSAAQETIAVLKETLSGQDYQDALDNLFKEYSQP